MNVRTCGLLVLVMAVSFAAPAAAAPHDNQKGAGAVVVFTKVNPFYTCVTVTLSLSVFANAPKHHEDGTIVATVDYATHDTCSGFDDDLAGMASLDAADVSFGDDSVVLIHPLVVDVRSELGYVQQFTFDLSWLAADGFSHVKGGGYEYSAPAIVNGEPILDLGLNEAFALSDLSAAELIRDGK